jgi:hypothetical protein
MTSSFIANLLILVSPFFAEPKEQVFHFTVSAGKQDRFQEPVCVLLPGIGAKDKEVKVLDAKSNSLSAQLTGPSLNAESLEKDIGTELHFLLPELKAGASLELTATVSSKHSGKEAEGFSWHDTKDDFLELRFAGKPVLRYQYAPLDEGSKESRDRTFKVFHHLFDPAGKRLVTNGPAGLYPHHRGLFYGFNRISYDSGKTADVWHCTGDAFQSHDKLLAQEAGPVLGRHRVAIGWHGPGKATFAEEERELTVYHVPGGRLVEFASVLRTKAGPVRLDGDPQHAGFHFRADEEVAEKSTKQTYFLRPDGLGKPGETRNWDPKTKQGPVNLPWNAMCFLLGGKRYTVAYLDKPTNPKEARFSEREYGRIGSYFEFDLTEKNPLRVNYRVWLQDGEMKKEDVEHLSRQFCESVKVIVK